MKAKIVKRIGKHYTEYVALEDGIIVTDSGDHPTFGLKSLEDMEIAIKKGDTFQLLNTYIEKNNLQKEILTRNLPLPG